MEEKMKNIIVKRLGEYRELAQHLNEDAFMDAVCTSFLEALSAKHYVVLMPVDLDSTFDAEQHRNLEKHGFHQLDNELMFSNMFIASQTVVDRMVEILRENEGMCADKCCDPVGNVMYVVSLYGVKDTHFERDFAQKNEKQVIND